MNQIKHYTDQNLSWLIVNWKQFQLWKSDILISCYAPSQTVSLLFYSPGSILDISLSKWFYWCLTFKKLSSFLSLAPRLSQQVFKTGTLKVFRDYSRLYEKTPGMVHICLDICIQSYWSWRVRQCKGHFYWHRAVNLTINISEHRDKVS